MLNKVQQFYTELFAAWGASTKIREDGALVTSDGAMQITARDNHGNSRSVYLPYPAVLERMPDGGILFHPLLQDMLGQEDPALLLFSRHVKMKLNRVINELLYALLELAANPKLQANIPTSSIGLLSLFNNGPKPEAVAKLSQRWQAAFESGEAGFDVTCKLNGERRFYLDLVIVRGDRASRGGMRHSRACTLSFPFLDEAKKEMPGSTKATPTTVWGVKMNRQEMEYMARLVEYILPDSLSMEPVMGTPTPGNNLCPSLEALMDVATQVGAKLNELVESLSRIPDFAQLAKNGIIDLSCREFLKDLNFRQYEGQIRVMRGPQNLPAEPAVAAAPHREPVHHQTAAQQQPAHSAAAQQGAPKPGSVLAKAIAEAESKKLVQAVDQYGRPVWVPASQLAQQQQQVMQQQPQQTFVQLADGSFAPVQQQVSQHMAVQHVQQAQPQQQMQIVQLANGQFAQVPMQPMQQVQHPMQQHPMGQQHVQQHVQPMSQVLPPPPPGTQWQLTPQGTYVQVPIQGGFQQGQANPLQRALANTQSADGGFSVNANALTLGV
jgi:hypothetical protein